MQRAQRIGLRLFAITAIAAVAVLAVLVVKLSDSAPRNVELVPRADPSSSARETIAATEPRSTPLARDPADGAQQSTPAAELDGYQVRGVVRSRAGPALAGARVTAHLEAAGSGRALGAIETGADGSYRLALSEVALLEDTLRGLARISIRASVAGYQDHEQVRSVAVRSADAPDAAVDTTIVCDFALLDGNRVRGRVVDASGQPVARAQVALWLDVDGDYTSRVVCAEDRTTRAGEFVLGFASSGTYALSAREEGTGTAYVAELELTAAEDRELGDIVLQGAGTLAGVLSYPDGQAARSFELWAVPESLADEDNALASAVRRGAEDERGDGLHYGRAITASDGSFRFGGLAPGRYALRAPKHGAVLEPHQARYPVGAQDIALRLESCRLLVRVTNRFGAPLLGATVACSDMTPLEDGSLEATHTRHATASGPAAVAAFDVEPETPLGLSASAPGSQTAEEVVVLMQGQHELQRELVLQPIGTSGRLRLILPRGPGYPSSAYASLASAVTQLPLVGVGVLEPDANGWLPPLAPGRYWVEVGFPARPHDMQAFFPWQSREPVEVRPDADQELVVEPRPGVRLDLGLEIAGEPPPELARGPRTGSVSAIDDPFLIRHGARVHLAAEDGSGERLLQFQLVSAANPGTFEVSSQLLPGTRATTETLLELGTYRLKIGAHGFRTHEVPLVLDRPGIAPLVVELTAE